jgi:class 3 adenylate cyclase
MLTYQSGWALSRSPVGTLQLAAIDEFLGEGEEATVGAEPTEPGGFATILFTDVEGSTALTQRLGDAKA